MPTPEFILRLREKIGNDLLLLPGVTGVVVNDRGQVLLVRSVNNGQWMPIGGCVEPGEEPADTILREIFEETGVTAEIDLLVSVDAAGAVQYPNGDRVNFVTTTFRCRAISGEPHVADEESTEVGYFAPDALPLLKPQHLKRIQTALKAKTGAKFTSGGVDYPRDEP